jgi:hypothetical protein
VAKIATLHSMTDHALADEMGETMRKALVRYA